MTGLRRPHTKSRNGCAQCKKRRVKCDLTGPICGNCRRRGEPCKYADLQFDNFVLASRGLGNLAAQAFPDATDDVGLMRHFSTSTAPTLALIPSDFNLWHRYVVNQAESCLFLQKGIICVSSLHIHHLQSSHAEEYYIRACTLQNEASSLFRQETDITEENIFQAFTFCIIVAIFNFYVSLHKRSQSDHVAEFDAFGPLLAIRSGSKLIQDSLSTAANAGLPDGLIGRLWKEPPPPLEASTHAAIAGLKKLEGVLSCPSASIQAIEFLRCSIIRFGIYPKGWLHIIVWPATVPSGYLEDLQQERPEAVVLFLYWCAVLVNAPKKWYLDGWAEAAAQSYLDKLSSEWMPFLNWPLSQLKLNDSQRHSSTD